MLLFAEAFVAFFPLRRLFLECSWVLNSFVPNAPFLYSILSPYGFLMISGVRESVHWEQTG